MPRVSVMMPVFNAASTLKLALSSVLAQDYGDWECIVVDDGSQDASANIVEATKDERIRLIRFTENRGRPIARRAALEAARGEYVCMLDADDWMYPERIGLQVRMLDRMPHVAAVSAGMAITSAAGDIVGARAFGHVACQPTTVSPPDLPALAHAPSMLRRSVIGDVRHDPRLKQSQDLDFMLRVLIGRQFVVMPQLLYAYAEHESVTAEKILLGQHYTRMIYRKYLGSRPLRASRNLLASYAKTLAYGVLFAAGLESRVVSARSGKPSAEQLQRFRAARADVLAQLARWPAS